MRTSRGITWARLRVALGALLLVLFALGGLLFYASFLAGWASNPAQSAIRTLGAALMALPAIAIVFATTLERRLRDE